jgi:acyl-coenzyme A synthetase/AMP-(fatty) acid ligase
MSTAFEFTSHSRYLPTTAFNVWHVYGASTACLRAGGTVVADTVEGKMDFAQSVTRHGITHASIMPIYLKRVLDDLPPDFIKPPNLTIHTFGAPIAETLRAIALERLAVEVFRVYGCNEAGAPCASRTSRKDGFASVWPETEVEIVDEDDRPVPVGTVGHVRVRNACMAEGYLDDPEATRRHFKDGWFYPQDMGVMNQQRQLKLVGRRDEVLNIGGQKVSPADLEEQVLRRASIADVGVCSFPNASGFEEVYFAVSPPEGDAAELLRRISAALAGLPLGKFYVVQLAQIPRNANGKILRDELKEAVAHAAGRTM